MQRLQDIILGKEKDRLHKLDQRVSDFDSRTRDVAEVLPSAMNRLTADPVAQPEFEKPIVETIRGAIKRDTESFAKVLFPVLGPAIRMAVADALKGLVQRINAAMENSFTIKGLNWRLEAARTGVPFAQIVLRHTMLYAIQEVFLIQRDSGLILSSAHRDELLALDEDAVAAMLTAIQSFIQDSFGISTDEPLRSAELGDRTVWVINGPSAVLACVISGTPPLEVREKLMGLLETLHTRFGQRLAEDPAGLTHHEGLQALMNKALIEEVDESVRTSSSRTRLLWGAGAVLLVLYLLFTTISSWRDRQFTRQVEALFRAQPGYVITAAEMHDGMLSISGLRDPESVHPAELLDEQQIAANRVSTEFSPYQSLDNAVVINRLKRRFGLDPSTVLSLEKDELSVSGTIASKQLAAMQTLPEYHALIRRINLDGVGLNGEEASNVFREALNAPDSVSFLPTQTRIEVSGSDDWVWYNNAREGAVKVPGWQLDFRPLEENLSAQLDQLIQGLSGSVFKYSDGTHLSAQSAARLDAVAENLVRAQGLANALRVNLDIKLEGSADGIGAREKNIEVSKSRSRHLLNEFIARGVSEQTVTQTLAPWDESGLNLERRKVTLLIERGISP